MERSAKCPHCGLIVKEITGYGENERYWLYEADGRGRKETSYYSYIKRKYHVPCREEVKRAQFLRYQATRIRGKKELVDHFGELTNEMKRTGREAEETRVNLEQFNELCDEMRSALSQLRARGLIR